MNLAAVSERCLHGQVLAQARLNLHVDETIIRTICLNILVYN